MTLETLLRLHAEPLGENPESVMEVSSITSRDMAESYLAFRLRKAWSSCYRKGWKTIAYELQVVCFLFSFKVKFSSFDMVMIAENPTTSPPLSTSSDSGEHENIVRGRSQIIKGEPSVSVQTVRGPYGDLVSEGSPAEISRTSSFCHFSSWPWERTHFSNSRQSHRWREEGTSRIRFWRASRSREIRSHFRASC